MPARRRAGLRARPGAPSTGSPRRAASTASPCAWSASARPSSPPAASRSAARSWRCALSNERDQQFVRNALPDGFDWLIARPARARHRRGRGRRRGRLGADADPFRQLAADEQPASQTPPSAAPGAARSRPRLHPPHHQPLAPAAALSCATRRLAASGRSSLDSTAPGAPASRPRLRTVASHARQDLPTRRGRGPHLRRLGSRPALRARRPARRSLLHHAAAAQRHRQPAHGPRARPSPSRTR